MTRGSRLRRLLAGIVAIELLVAAYLSIRRMQRPYPPAAVLMNFRAEGPFGRDLGKIWPGVLGRAASESSAQAWLDAARLYLSVGYYPEAQLAAGHACVLAPDWFEARFVHGICHDLLGRTSEAIAELERAVRLTEDRDLHVWYLIGRNHLRAERPEAAIAAFARAADYPPVAHELARTLLRLGKRPQADRAIAHLAGLVPSSYEGLRLAAKLAELDGDEARAAALRQRLDAATAYHGYNPIRDVVRMFRVAYDRSQGIRSPEGRLQDQRYGGK